MSGGMVKYLRQRTGDERLHWGRAVMDGMPFRGGTVPMYREEEFEDKTVAVYDAKIGFFDPGANTTREDAMGRVVRSFHEYVEVLDRVANGWYRILHIDRNYVTPDGHRYFYMEWLEPYLEDGTRAGSTQQNAIFNRSTING